MADNTNTTTVHTAEVVRYDDPVIITERVAVAAFIAQSPATPTPPARPTPRICGSSLTGATTTASIC